MVGLGMHGDHFLERFLLYLYLRMIPQMDIKRKMDGC